jgi:hypothetical protein
MATNERLYRRTDAKPMVPRMSEITTPRRHKSVVMPG